MRHSASPPVSTTAADISRNFAQWQDQALSTPVIVTYHGRPRVVLISAEQYAAWTQVEEAPRDADYSNVEVEVGLNALLNHTSEGFVALDPDLTIVAVNTVAEDYYGYPRERLVGQRIVSAFPNTRGSLVVDRIQRVLRTGKADLLESPSAVHAGRFVRTSIFPYPGGVALLFRDETVETTERDRLARLAALEAALEATSAMSTLSLNVRGAVTEASPPFSDLTGLSPDRIVGQPLADFFALPDRRPVRERLEQVIQLGEASSQQVRLLTNSDEVPVQLAMAPVLQDHAITAVVAIITVDRAAKR